MDAIRPPLTGIGRYAWELARHYQATEKLRAVRYFADGRWIADPDNLRTAQSKTRRPFLSTSRWLARRKLALRLRSHLFHSPNYFLPPQVNSGIVTVHDLSVFKFPETHPLERIRQFEKAFTFTLSRCRHIITDSESTRLEVADYFNWPLERVTAIPLGVGADFHPRSPSTLKAQLFSLGLTPASYALCVSTLEPRKRISNLIDAYRRIPATLRTSYPLVLAGSSGWLNDNLLAQIQVAEEEGWLRYLGYVDESILPVLYAGARAFFFPSIYEGFGLPVLESLASGVPVLASDRTPIRNIVEDATFLTDSNDVDALVTGITEVLSNESWRSAAILRGIEIAKRHSWANCADRTIDLYQRIGV
ncbi:glycosyltransferase family 1 protein [Paraburkholderia sejongensis]|uniref:glycosyltransferase family 4 protein n=1 Tax=Paraburkholderia sejongensis TaxID=2886946 RepID=UPI002E769EF3|nr:glycosyltransferase family 1 protein [Paraburkholderia sp. MMS20-SJTR3]